MKISLILKIVTNKRGIDNIEISKLRRIDKFKYRRSKVNLKD